MLTVIILTKNEEKNIIDAIESTSFADEIIVIDDYSSDHTAEAIEALRNPHIKIFKRHLDDYSSQRNFALKKAMGDWVLFLDADERISPGLRGEIQQILKDGSSNDGYYVKRTDVMWGKELKYGETANVRLLRFAKKNRGEWRGKVHEEWEVKGSKSELKFPLYHFPHPTVSDFLTDINRYTEMRADELYEKKKTTSLFQIIIYPLAKFFQNYIVRLGFKDGLPGFIFAVLMSLHSFLVRGKLYFLQNSLSKN